MIGREIGPYRLEKELGQGGMGSVYLGVRFDRELEMKASIKLINHRIVSPETLKLFRRERQLLADLKHPYIATLLDAGATDDGFPYFIMDFIEGRRIDDWCRRQTPTLGKLLRLYRNLVEAVGFAHGKGVIHRDIKPGNLMVSDDDNPILLDFGIAQFAGMRDENDRDRVHSTPMTPLYAAPELKQHGEAGPYTDIYALGLVLLELLTGYRPDFWAQAPLETVTQLIDRGRLWRTADSYDDTDTAVATQTGPEPQADKQALYPPEPGTETDVKAEPMPEALGYVLRTMLAPDFQHRYTNVDALLYDMDKVIAGLPDDHHAPSPLEKIYDTVIWRHPDDKRAVEALAAALMEKDLVVWFEESNNTHEIGSALDHSRSCVICLGPGGGTPWTRDDDIRDHLAFHAEDLRILPLLLPGAAFPKKQSLLPRFLRRKAWFGLSDRFTYDHLAKEICYQETEDDTLPPPTGACPFRGLEVFREEDRDLFYGREIITQRIARYMNQNHPFAAVLGPSGSGKSSILQAGVIPRLRDDGLIPILLRPSMHPLAELAEGLAPLFQAAGRDQEVDGLADRLAGSDEALYYIGLELFNPIGPICLVIDQFEETFTLTSSTLERDRFIAALCHTLDQPRGKVTVLVSMRSDFLGKCTQYPNLNNLVSDHLFQVTPMDRDDLKRAIEKPARRCGLRLEHGLLDQILDDVAGSAGELPLLEHALLELYDRHRDGLLTLAAYAEIGGVEGALARRAESEYETLNELGRNTLRKMFTLCLIHPGEGAEDTRRRATRDELVAVGTSPEEVDHLLARWTSARLLTGWADHSRHTDMVDVAHEALIRKWPRISEWMAQDRETARLLNRVRRDAATWRHSGCDEDHLPRGGPLVQITDLMERERDNLGEAEISYINAARALRLRIRQGKLRTRNILIGLTAAALILALSSTIMYFRVSRAEQASRAAALETHAEKERAEKETLIANYNLALALDKMTGIALDEQAPQQAWLLSLAALSKEIPSDRSLPEIHGRFVDPRMGDVNHLLWTSPTAPRLRRIAANRAGNRIAAVDHNGLIHMMDQPTGANIALLSDAAAQRIVDISFDPSNQFLAASTEKGGLYLWRTVNGELEFTHEQPAVNDLHLAFSRNLLAVGGSDGWVRLLDLNTHENRGRVQFGAAIKSMTVNRPEVLYAALANGDIVSADMQSGAQKKVHHSESAVTIMDTTPAGLLVWGAMNGSLGFYNPISGSVALENLHQPVLGLATDPLSERVIATTSDGAPYIWQAGHISLPPANPNFPKSQLHLQPGNLLWGMDRRERLLCYDLDANAPHVAALGHADAVRSVAWSPDGDYLLSGSRDGTLILWDQTGANHHRMLRTPSGAVTDLTVSPDGLWLAAACSDHTIKIWSMASIVITDNGPTVNEAPLQVLAGHQGDLFTVAFSPQSNLLASGSQDQSIIIWRRGDDATAPFDKAGDLRGHTGEIQDLAFSPDGRRLLSGSDDRTLRLWSIPTDVSLARTTQILKGHSSRVMGVAFSPDGDLIASASVDQTIRLWSQRGNPSKFKSVKTLRGHTAAVIKTAFSPNSKMVVGVSDDRTLRIWHLERDSHDELKSVTSGKTLVGHANDVVDLAFSPDGDRLASASVDHTIRLWDPGPAANTNLFRDHQQIVMGVSFSPDGRLLASASDDQTVLVRRLTDLDPSTGLPQTHELDHRGAGAVSAVFSPNGRHLATTAFDGAVRLWHVPAAGSPMPIWTKYAHDGAATGIAFAQAGKLMATGSYDGTVRLWNTTAPADKVALAVLKGHKARVYGVAFTADGSKLATGSDDRTIRLWRLEQNQKPDTHESAPSYNSDIQAKTTVLKGHSDRVYAVSFSPDGSQLASASADRTIRLWDADTGQLNHILTGHDSRTYGVAFSPDGHRLATSSADRTVRIWDPYTGEPLAVLQGHQGEVNWFIAFSPDGSLLATPSDDRSVRLWEMNHLLKPPQGVTARDWYRQMLKRSLYQMGYRLDGFRLLNQPRMRLHGLNHEQAPSPWRHLEYPRPPDIDHLSWLSRE